MALLTGGGYAEEVVTPADTVMSVPSCISDVDAGGVPEVFLTAFLNLFMLGGLGSGQNGTGPRRQRRCRHRSHPADSRRRRSKRW